ncbi:U32 family peptidase [Vibrio sp. JC009]|uniref:peptidase U32 family protein n=1 Tax=Vibrio sp. JC009 TaxID=2912314 RepID=UPI0023AF284F|nr:peptidase U32 family protein [Vibrio sp. JC009]WED24826.1 U32 family peptidase [Vibrio sp. JC009]
MDKSQFELLAPGGDAESIKAAIVAGADAVYCGLNRFNARNRATNLTLDELNEVVNIAHQHHCKIFVTLNIIIMESEIAALVRMLNTLLKTEIDGVIFQDLGLAYILKHYYPQLDIHASTQLNTHNEGQIQLLKQFGSSRVNLSRELNINEITRLAQFGHQHDVLMEVFVHGSYCIGFSGLCYVSSVRNGASGNRGRCSQPCRDEFQLTEAGVRHPLNMKDNSAFADLKQLADAGVYSLKVEGRIKGSHYVYTVVDNWRRQIDSLCEEDSLLEDTKELYTVYNRDFSDGYLQGEISKEMYIDNPRDNSVQHFVDLTGDDVSEVKQKLYDDKTAIIKTVENRLATLKVDESLTGAEFAQRKGVHETVILDALKAGEKKQVQPELSVLISSKEDIASALQSGADVFYQLPDGLDYYFAQMEELLRSNPQLTPWFSAVLIDKDYDAAVRLLSEIKPKQIVTNNLGIGWAAFELGIDWIAGPQLNIANSFALKALKEEFNCSGAFISNEINKRQMERLVTPEDFRLYHSIYHPIAVMTSRQCLFQQSIGCKKKKINRGCLPRCNKHTSIINLKDSAYIIDKQKGEYNCIYSQHHFMNTQVVEELPELFSDYLIDLRNIQTETSVKADKPEIIAIFRELITGNAEAGKLLADKISPTTNAQYLKGL